MTAHHHATTAAPADPTSRRGRKPSTDSSATPQGAIIPIRVRHRNPPYTRQANEIRNSKILHTGASQATGLRRLTCGPVRGKDEGDQ